jgi:hypothetical protein
VTCSATVGVTEHWNTDAFGYQDDSPLYTSHPWVLAVRADGSAFGVLADSTYRVFIDLTDGIRFESEGPAHPVIVIDGDSPQEVVTRLGDADRHHHHAAQVGDRLPPVPVQLLPRHRA